MEEILKKLLNGIDNKVEELEDDQSKTEMVKLLKGMSSELRRTLDNGLETPEKLDAASELLDGYSKDIKKITENKNGK